MPVVDRHALGRPLGQPSGHLGGVGGVRDQQHPVVGVEVGDQVVDDPAGGVVAAQRVLGLAVLDPAEVVGERGVDVVGGSRADDGDLAEVAHVEDADRLTDGGVLLDHAGGVLQRHRPAAEVGELRAQRHVPLVQWRLQRRRLRRSLGRGLCAVHARNLPRLSCASEYLHAARCQRCEDPLRRGGRRGGAGRQGRGERADRRAGRGGRRKGLRPRVPAAARLPRRDRQARRGHQGADRQAAVVAAARARRARQARQGRGSVGRLSYAARRAPRREPSPTPPRSRSPCLPTRSSSCAR